MIATNHSATGPQSTVWLAVLLAVSCWGCENTEDSPSAVPNVSVQQAPGDEVAYGEDRDVVLQDGDTYIVDGDPGDTCVEIEAECIEIGEAKGRFCADEGAQADVVVVDGEVVDVICYPNPEGGTPLEEVQADENGTVMIPQNESGAVIVFGEETNGEPLEGDVTVDAERTTLYGNGPDQTILEGDLRVASNNSRVRGIEVTGNVHYEGNSNGSALAFCRVRGSLTIASNKAVVANCDIFGDVTVEGNGATLINVGVGGDWSVKNHEVCEGCYTFEDENEDFLVTEEERGELICGDDPSEE